MGCERLHCDGYDRRDGYGWAASTDGACGVAEHQRRLDVVGQRHKLLLAEHGLDEGEDALRGSGGL